MKLGLNTQTNQYFAIKIFNKFLLKNRRKMIKNPNGEGGFMKYKKKTLLKNKKKTN